MFISTCVLGLGHSCSRASGSSSESRCRSGRLRVCRSWVRMRPTTVMMRVRSTPSFDMYCTPVWHVIQQSHFGIQGGSNSRGSRFHLDTVTSSCLLWLQGFGHVSVMCWGFSAVVGFVCDSLLLPKLSCVCPCCLQCGLRLYSDTIRPRCHGFRALDMFWSRMGGQETCRIHV